MSLKEGLIVSAFGKFYLVEDQERRRYRATLRGKLRLEYEEQYNNPVAVGDKVLFQCVDEQNCVIEKRLPRRNYIARRSVHRRGAIQVMAANVDQAILVATIKKPFTPLTYIDKFTVMCEAYGIPLVILFNKVDLLKTERLQKKLNDYLRIYSSIGYTVHAFSAIDKSYRSLALSLLKDKVSFLAGVSGAGKSSFVNLVDPSLNIRTQPLAKHTEKGRHTTTYAAMYHLSVGGSVIDAPGFQDFTLVDVSPLELAQYFPEMRSFARQCRYNDCTHINEPDCAVLNAVASNFIAHTRYNTYVNIFYELQGKALV